MNVKYKVFEDRVNKWETLLDQAAEFAGDRTMLAGDPAVAAATAQACRKHEGVIAAGQCQGCGEMWCEACLDPARSLCGDCA